MGDVVAHALLNGPVQVGGSVSQGQTREDTARLGVGVGGAVALEVFVDD